MTIGASDNLALLDTDKAELELHPAVPRVTCPQCGGKMRLAEVIPDLHDRPEMRYRCTCGFYFSMSARESDGM
jgi:DNA-directed RNA polymerase subunit M/transcription elongation factor TFIIS